jgi:hypothetical protein
LPLDMPLEPLQWAVLSVVFAPPSGAQKNLAAAVPTHYAWC